MKRSLLFILFVFGALRLLSQVPEKLSYQAIVRDAKNELVVDKIVSLRFSIITGVQNGSLIYQEKQSVLTNSNGLVSTEIGSGEVISGDFESINWAANEYYIKTEVDSDGNENYTISSTNQLLSVPYALHAKSALSVINDKVEDADADPENEIELPIGGFKGQVLSTDGNGVYSWVDPSSGTYSPLTEEEIDDYVANNGYLTEEVDGSVTNEIELPEGGAEGQVLKTDGSGNYAWVNQTIDTDTRLDETTVDSYVSNNGYLTAEVDGSVTNEIELPTGGVDGQVLRTDGNGNYTWVDQTVDTDTNTQLDEATVDTYVANNGYLTTEVDGSVTNEIELPAGGAAGQVLKTDGNGNYAWVNQTVDTDTNTQLDEATVDSYVSNNGYLTAEVDGSVTNEIELPVGGVDGQVLKTDGNDNYAWVNQTVDTNTQLDEATVDNYVSNNGYLTSEVDGSVTNELELPAQGGHAGKFLSTNGSSVSWEAAPTGGGASFYQVKNFYSYGHENIGEYLLGQGTAANADINYDRVYIIAPYNGRLVSVSISTTSVSAGSTFIALRKNRSTADIESQTVSSVAGSVVKAIFTNATFNAGDLVHLFVKPTNTITGEALVVTTVWEYTP